MVHLHEQCVDEGSWQVGARAALDLAITISSQHLEAHMNRQSTHLVRLLYTAPAAGGLLCAVVGRSNIAIVASWMLGMLAVLVAFVLTGTGVLLGVAHLAKRPSRAIPT